MLVGVNKVQLFNEADQLTGKSHLALNEDSNLKKKFHILQNKIWWVGIGKSSCNSCWKQLSTFAVRMWRCSSCLAHAARPPKMWTCTQPCFQFPLSVSSASRQILCAECADWAFVSRFCSVLSNESLPTRLGIHIYFHLGVKTWWKKWAGSVLFS